LHLLPQLFAIFCLVLTSQILYFLHPFFLTAIGAIFILLLVLVKLALYSRGKVYLNSLLTVAIFGVIWYVIIYLLTNSGQISNYPILFNKGLPFYYLATPCMYLYIRGSLHPSERHFRKAHLIHLLIIIPALIAIIPYNLLSISEQQVVVNHVVKDVRYALNGDKYIVSAWHWFALPGSALIYILFQIKMIRSANKVKAKASSVIRWLYVFSGVWAVIFFTMLVVNFSILKDFNNAWYILNQSYLVFWACLLLLMLSVLFFLNPEFIYGLVRHAQQVEADHTLVLTQTNFDLQGQQLHPEIKTVPGAVITDAPVSPIVKKAKNEELVKLVESQLLTAKLFRQSGLTLSVLSSLIGIPTHKLSDMFNSYYGVNFNVYINNLRIEYVKQRLHNGDWKQYTLEAIGLDAGFSSRNTFFVAFKKVTGLNPSAYLSGLKESQK